ncbi:MAG: hypothetical protein AAFP84_13890 [Actinomycetota bacterium]
MGLATQDSLGEAVEFVERFSTLSFTQLWDESFESWIAVGFTSQPAAILYSPDGVELGRWRGVFDEAEVLELAANA